MARDPVRVVVAVGANIGDAAATVTWAMDQLSEFAACEVRKSNLWCSAPVDAQGPDFINAAVSFETRLTAPDLLCALQTLENQAARTRPYRNAPRSLDLDLIFYGSAQMQSAKLSLPHPRWRERAFVLRPLAEIADVSAADLAAVSNQRIERV